MRDWNIRENERLGWNLVCNLDVIFDSKKLSMRSQISKTASACFFHLRRLRQLHGVVIDKVSETVSDVTDSHQTRLL